MAAFSCDTVMHWPGHWGVIDMAGGAGRWLPQFVGWAGGGAGLSAGSHLLSNLKSFILRSRLVANGLTMK